MGWQSSPGRLALAAAGLLGLVNGQAYFGSFQTTIDKCGADNFVYLSCYGNFEDITRDFHFGPHGFSRLDPSRSFPGWDPGSYWDSTQTPLDCARTCRAFGYKYSAMRDNNCNCGLQLPAAAVPNTDNSACDRPCNGDVSVLGYLLIFGSAMELSRMLLGYEIKFPVARARSSGLMWMNEIKLSFLENKFAAMLYHSLFRTFQVHASFPPPIFHPSSSTGTDPARNLRSVVIGYMY